MSISVTFNNNSMEFTFLPLQTCNCNSSLKTSLAILNLKFGSDNCIHQTSLVLILLSILSNLLISVHFHNSPLGQLCSIGFLAYASAFEPGLIRTRVCPRSPHMGIPLNKQSDKQASNLTVSFMAMSHPAKHGLANVIPSLPQTGLNSLSEHPHLLLHALYKLKSLRCRNGFLCTGPFAATKVVTG